jgi:hypothetical protein
MLALSALTPTVVAIGWLIAIVLFLAAAFGTKTRINLLALGLAVASFIPFWAALARA